MSGSAENMKFSIMNLDESYKKLGLSERDIAARRMVNLRPANLQSVLVWIDSLGLDPGVAADFKKAASRYPHQALGRFMERHESILHSIVRARREMNRPNSNKDEDNGPTKEAKKGLDHFQVAAPDRPRVAAQPNAQAAQGWNPQGNSDDFNSPQPQPGGDRQGSIDQDSGQDTGRPVPPADLPDPDTDPDRGGSRGFHSEV